MLISTVLWKTAACGKGPTICTVYLMVDLLYCQNECQVNRKTKSWHVLFKVHIYENLLAGDSLKAISVNGYAKVKCN